ncbi:response regulator, partial [Desulfovibrio legallii]
MRVLIVDDEAAFARPLAERLSLRGVETATAADAPEALASLERQDCDLIFLDVGLPGMDGVALLKVLREKYPRTDVVMLSGAADMGKAVQAMRRGALNWLSKPVRLDDVLAECRKADERARAREEAARLAEAARWRSLGRVAEGVAHEVNNPLNIIVQAAGLVRDCLDAPEAAALPEVDEAREAVALIRTQSL